MTKLKGIGPATASLLLSVYEPHTAPFFSDELFRWCFFEEGKGKGWDREIKYNLKEYLDLYGKVQELRERFKKDYRRGISAVEIEKVAYVLGKQATGGSSTQANSRGQKRKTDDDGDEVVKTSKTGAKPASTIGNKQSTRNNAPESKKQTAASTRTRRGAK